MFKKKVEDMLRTFLKTNVDEHLMHYIVVNAHEVLYMSQKQLCTKAGVTNEQLMTFLRAFGVDKFVAFKFILRKCLYYEVTANGVEKRTPASLANEVLLKEMQNLSEFVFTLDHEKLLQLAKDITEAPEVNIICTGSPEPLGYHLLKMLRFHNIKANYYNTLEKDGQRLLDMLDPASLIINFSRRRYSMRLLMLMKLLHQYGFRIVNISDSADAPSIPLSNYYFVLPTDSFDFNDSLSAGFMLNHLLSLFIGQMNEDALFTRMHRRDIETQEANMFW